MLKLNEFSHNHHPSKVKMLAEFVRRGISVLSGQAGMMMHTDSKMFTIGTDDFIPLEYFNLKWRWDPSNQPEIRPDQLALIHPLRKEISQKAWLASI